MEERDNTGIVFVNNYKEKQSQPDYKGTMVWKGEKIEVAMWVKEGQNGTFLTMSLQEPYVKPIAEAVNAEVKDDLPF